MKVVNESDVEQFKNHGFLLAKLAAINPTEAAAQ
jgi:hypothetical protein